MKLVLAIVHDDQANQLMHALSQNEFSVTKLATTGGFLRAANTTLICGTEEEKIPKLLEIIKTNCSARKQLVPDVQMHASIGTIFPLANEIMVGGATCFVLDVDQFSKF